MAVMRQIRTVISQAIRGKSTGLLSPPGPPVGREIRKLRESLRRIMRMPTQYGENGPRLRRAADRGLSGGRVSVEDSYHPVRRDK